MSKLNPLPYRIALVGPGGLISQQWVRFFEQLNSRIGGTTSDTIPEVSEKTTTAQGTADTAVEAAAHAQADATTGIEEAAKANVKADDLITMLAIPAGLITYGTGTGVTSEAGFSYDSTTNTLTVPKIRGALWSGAGAGVVVTDDGAATKIGLFGVTPIARPTTSGAAATFTANSGTAVNDASTFDGYTIKQIVKALRDIGALT